MESHPEVAYRDASTPQGSMEKRDQMKKVKWYEEVGALHKREPELQASPKRHKLEEHVGVILKNRIQLVKDSIESRHFMKALNLINVLHSEFPSSALVLALKALVYEKTVGKDEALSICSDAKQHMLSDISCLPDVLTTLETVGQRLGCLGMVTSYYEHACGKVGNSLELMRGLFNCYARESSFVNQLKVSLRMYKLAREDKFLFWAVFCIQLQVLSQWLKKQDVAHNLDEPDALLVYISITEQQTLYDPAHEIFSKLGPTLLVMKFDKQHLEGGKLLAHVCDYAAAVEVFKKILESCIPGDWESLLNDFGCSLEDDSKWCGGATENIIQPPVYLACKISQLPSEKCGSEISKALKLSNLEHAINRCLDGKDNHVFKEAIFEYFNRVNHTTKRFFQILSKDEEYQLIENLIKPDILTTDLLKEEFSKISTVSRIPKYHGDFLGEKSIVHGTTIVLKTSKFIILAADGKLTSAYSHKALFSTSDKIRQFDDLCIAVSGVWKGLSSTVSILRKYMRYLNKNGKGRPTVRKLAGYIVEVSRLLNRATEVIVCAFDELEDGKPPVPCVSCADIMCWDVKESFYCSGSCGSNAEHILSEGNVHPDMGLAEAVDLVEKALVYVTMFDSCSGGFANITMIDHCKNVTVMPREHIRTTLWERHHHFFENRVS